MNKFVYQDVLIVPGTEHNIEKIIRGSNAKKI